MHYIYNQVDFGMLFVFVFVFCTLCCRIGNFSHGKFGSLSTRKASCNRVTLPNPDQLLNACWVISCFHNPPNADMDYMFFNVRIRGRSNACGYTHGGWAHRQRVSTTFLTRKISHTFWLCSWRRRVSNLGSLLIGSRVRRCTIWATPCLCVC